MVQEKPGRRYRVVLVTEDPGHGEFDFLLLPIPTGSGDSILLSHSQAIWLADDINALHKREYDARTGARTDGTPHN